MAKYTLQFKKEVVRRYEAGPGGYKALGYEYGLAPSLIHGWVHSYRHHGEPGLLRSAGRYSAEFKQSTLRRIECEGLSDNAGAGLVDVRTGATIREWRAQEQAASVVVGHVHSRGDLMEYRKPPKPADENMSAKELLKENEELRARIELLLALHEGLAERENELSVKKKRK